MLTCAYQIFLAETSPRTAQHYDALYNYSENALLNLPFPSSSVALPHYHTLPPVSHDSTTVEQLQELQSCPILILLIYRFIHGSLLLACFLE